MLDLPEVGARLDRTTDWTARVTRREPVSTWAEERIALVVEASIEASLVWARETLRAEGIVVDLAVVGRPDPLTPDPVG